MTPQPIANGSNRPRQIFAAGIAACVLLALAATTMPQDDPVALPSNRDFDTDAEVDAMIGDPAENATPGTVEIRSGASNALIVRMQGRVANDRFGQSAVVVGDVSGDGIDDIVVGAPRDGNGHAFVFAGPFSTECPIVIDAAHANMVLSALPDEYDFGFEVAPLYDIDNDQVPEIRVAAKVLGTQTEVIYRTVIFSGWTGDRIATATGTGPFAALVPIGGDTDYDADVDQDDLARVVANLGRSGQLTRYDGDVNDDGVVNSQDVSEVNLRLGLRAYDTVAATGSCPGQPSCVIIAPEPPAEYCLCEVTPNNGTPVASLELATSAAGLIVYPGTPCTALLTNCLTDPRVTEALQLIDTRCYGPGGNAPSTVATLYCKACPPGQFAGETKIRCGLFGRKIEIILCDSAPDFCATLAHELVHASQACAAGLFNDCDDYKRWAKNQYHRMCAEIEALMLAGQCVDVVQCCSLACESSTHGGGWRNCPLSCEDCCVQGSWDCCLHGRNTCLDNGANPCGAP